MPIIVQTLFRQQTILQTCQRADTAIESNLRTEGVGIPKALASVNGSSLDGVKVIVWNYD